MSDAARDDMPAVQTGANYPPAGQGAYSPPPVRIAEKVYLTMDEAAQLSGLSTGYLNEKIKSGQLKELKDGEPKLRRSDLEQL